MQVLVPTQPHYDGTLHADDVYDMHDVHDVGFVLPMDCSMLDQGYSVMELRLAVAAALRARGACFLLVGRTPWLVAIVCSLGSHTVSMYCVVHAHMDSSSSLLSTFANRNATTDMHACAPVMHWLSCACLAGVDLSMVEKIDFRCGSVHVNVRTSSSSTALRIAAVLRAGMHVMMVDHALPALSP